MTKVKASEIINEYRDETNYFSGGIKAKDMYEMFRYRMQFGEAESKVIIAALIKAGAKFQGDL